MRSAIDCGAGVTRGEFIRSGRRRGYWAHGVGWETVIGPAGWRKRLVCVEVPTTRGVATAWCIETHDLVLAKLAAGPDHDRRFVDRAIRSVLVEPTCLRMLGDRMPARRRKVVAQRLEAVLRHG